MSQRAAPASARILNQWVDSYARREKQPPSRVRNWVSYMVLGGALQRAGFVDDGPRFTIKGGVAVELRLRSLARATKDLDLVLNGGGDFVQEIEAALREAYEGFTFRLKGDAELMPNGAARMQIALVYRGKGWDTVTVDVAHPERGTTDVEMVGAIPLAHLGLNGPEHLPCLSLPYHVAQKIHAMTLPDREDRRNDRFKDLVDLLLLREVVHDHPRVKQACIEVFEERGTHPWPPYVDPPEHWAEPFRRMAEECGLDHTELFDAADAARWFLRELDETSPVTCRRTLPPGATATSWFFAVAADDRVYNVPHELGEALVMGTEPRQPIVKEWERDPGGMALFGAVVVLQERRPLYVERVCFRPIASGDEAVGRSLTLSRDAFRGLARAIQERARTPVRGVDAMARFIAATCGSGRLPCELGELLTVTTRQASKVVVDRGNRRHEGRLLWDLWRSHLAEETL